MILISLTGTELATLACLARQSEKVCKDCKNFNECRLGINKIDYTERNYRFDTGSERLSFAEEYELANVIEIEED